MSCHHNFLPLEGPSIWCVVQGSSPPLQFGEGLMSGLSLGQKVLCRFSASCWTIGCWGRRGWKGEDGETQSLWPLCSIPTQKEKAERKQCERNVPKSWVLCDIILCKSKRKLWVLIESHLWHSSSLKLSLTETWLNKALKHMLYLKVFEEASSLLKHIEALLQVILWSEALWCKSAITLSKSVVFS